MNQITKDTLVVYHKEFANRKIIIYMTKKGIT